MLLNFLSTAPSLKAWNYALFLSYLTFDFLILRAFREAPSVSLYRVLMIAAGASIGALVMWVPPQLLAYEQAATHLGQMLRDCADAAREVTHTFASGRLLRDLSQACCVPSHNQRAFA